MPSFGKRTPFGEQHLKPFEAVYAPGVEDAAVGACLQANPHPSFHPENRTEGEYSFNAEEIDLSADAKKAEENQDTDEQLIKSRWRCFTRDWIADHKSDSLDIAWLKDSDSVDAANLPEPEVLAGEAMSELVQALGELDGLMRELGAGEKADVQKSLIGEMFGDVQ